MAAEFFSASLSKKNSEQLSADSDIKFSMMKTAKQIFTAEDGVDLRPEDLYTYVCVHLRITYLCELVFVHECECMCVCVCVH